MSEKVGRPRKEIDKRQFEHLCGLQCTEEEVCSFFDVSDKTLTRWCKETYGKSFSEVFQEKRAIGKVSLRRNQWKLSEKSAAMAIFLGKNYLGQRDQLKDDLDDTAKQLIEAVSKVLGGVDSVIE